MSAIRSRSASEARDRSAAPGGGGAAGCWGCFSRSTAASVPKRDRSRLGPCRRNVGRGRLELSLTSQARPRRQVLRWWMRCQRRSAGRLPSEEWPNARVRVHRSAPPGRGHHPVPAGDRRGCLHLRGRRPHVPQGRAGGAAQAGRRGDARHLALPAPGPPRAAAPDHRRPRGLAQRQVRRAGPAEEREHRGRGRPAHVPGHRHGDRHGQARAERADRGRRRGGPVAAASTTRTPSSTCATRRWPR